MFPPFAPSGQASLPQGERLRSDAITLIRDEPVQLAASFRTIEFCQFDLPCQQNSESMLRTNDLYYSQLQFHLNRFAEKIITLPVPLPGSKLKLLGPYRSVIFFMHGVGTH